MDLVEVDFNIENRHPWELARLKVVKSILKKQKKEIKSILDVGSGDAFVANELSKEFKKSNAYCVDIEYTESIKKTIKDKFKNNNLNLFKNLIDVKEVNIDIVTLLDVIEHVEDDVALLNSIINTEGVSNKTRFLITVPAYQNLFSKHDVALKHYRRYTLKSLKTSVNKSGLIIIKKGYFFTSLIPPRILQLLKEKVVKTEITDLENLGSWNKGKIITNLISSILYLDYQLGNIISKLGIYIPGLSCYAICKLLENPKKE